MRLYHRLFAITIGALTAGAAHADITLGQVVPLTGEHAAAGQAGSAGARAYVDKVNAEGGIAGHKIILLVRDNQDRADETVAQAARLIRQDRVYGLLPDAGVAGSRELVASGLLRQARVPLLALRNVAVEPPLDSLSSAEEGFTRDAGLVEITPPVQGYAEVVGEYRAALAQYAPGTVYSAAGLRGYMAAKVMVGMVRMLSATPTREDYFLALRNMLPALADRLVVSTTIAQ